MSRCRGAGRAAGTVASRFPDKPHPYAADSTARVALIFGAACVVTLIAGVALEESGDALATHFGVNGVIFGATILATASALPEISSGSPRCGSATTRSRWATSSAATRSRSASSCWPT